MRVGATADLSIDRLARTEMAMRDVYGASFVSLHVRRTNRAAIGLYRDTLGFEQHEVEKAYCESGAALR